MADLATTLSATPEPVATGDQLTYAITVTNNGPDAAEDTLLHMVFPEGVTIQELSIGQGACWLKAPRVVTCEAGEVASGAVVPYAVLVHVGAPAGSTLQANVAVDSSVADRVPANDKAEVVSSVSE